jgi:DNA-binding response OmpR family regulator
MTKIIVDEAILEHLAQEKALFSRTDFAVIPCATKGQALTAHEQENADLILIDFKMPEMNIEDFCTDVRANEKMKHALIVVASEDKRDNLERCLKCGVDAIVIKPVNHQELIDKTTKLLHIKKREQVRVLMKISVTGKIKDTFYSTSHDVSVSGISIETEKNISMGDKASIIFYLRTNKIETEGKVVRKKEMTDNAFQYGIRFLKIDDHSRSLIEIFVKMHEDF